MSRIASGSVTIPAPSVKTMMASPANPANTPDYSLAKPNTTIPQARKSRPAAIEESFNESAVPENRVETSWIEGIETLYLFLSCPLPLLVSIFAQVSFNATVRLNTGLPGFESGSTQKYPKRSN